MNDIVSIRKMRPLGLIGIFTGTGAAGVGEMDWSVDAAGPADSAPLDDGVFLGGKILV
jgi:hypothetical protein